MYPYYDLALSHQLAAPLAGMASKRGESLPEPWAQRLRSVRIQNLAFEPALAELSEILNSFGFPWLAARGAARLADPVLPERLCGDVDLYIKASHWPDFAAALCAEPGFAVDPQRGDKNRSTRHILMNRGLRIELDVHLAPSPFHAEGHELQERLLAGRVSQASGLFVPSPEDDYGIALIEALIEAPANRLRRIWELEALQQRLSPEQERKACRRFALHRYARGFPAQILKHLQGRLLMRNSEQLLVRYGGLLALLGGSRRPFKQSTNSLAMMLRRFRA